MLQFLLESGSGESGAANTGSPWTIIILLLVFVGFYFLMIRPEKKREKAAQEMRAALQVGDEVTTIGGIIGKVISIKEETFVLETTKERTHIRFLVSAIRSVDVKAEEAAAARPRVTTPAGTKPAPKKAEKPAIEAPAVTEPTVEEVLVEEPVVEEPVAEIPSAEGPINTEATPDEVTQNN